MLNTAHVSAAPQRVTLEAERTKKGKTILMNLLFQLADL